MIQGIAQASLAGRGVINLSLGGPEKSFFMAQAIVLAFGRGTIIVAAAGNEFENGNPLSYPADDPHVLTVGATTEDDKPASFSSSSSAVDLAAPGVDIPVAVPLVDDPSGYTTLNGTSFSSPLVAGATAWVWTARPDAREDAGLRPDALVGEGHLGRRLGPGHRLRAARHPARALP